MDLKRDVKNIENAKRASKIVFTFNICNSWRDRIRDFVEMGCRIALMKKKLYFKRRNPPPCIMLLEFTPFRMLVSVVLFNLLVLSASGQKNTASITGRVLAADGNPAYVTVELKSLKKDNRDG